MDPNEKPGSKWPTLPPAGKLDFLIRYREICKKKDTHFLLADDFFYRNVVDEGLEQELVNRIAFSFYQL